MARASQKQTFSDAEKNCCSFAWSFLLFLRLCSAECSRWRTSSRSSSRPSIISWCPIISLNCVEQSGGIKESYIELISENSQYSIQSPEKKEKHDYWFTLRIWNSCHKKYSRLRSPRFAIFSLNRSASSFCSRTCFFSAAYPFRFCIVKIVFSSASSFVFFAASYASLRHQRIIKQFSKCSSVHVTLIRFRMCISQIFRNIQILGGSVYGTFFDRISFYSLTGNRRNRLSAR